jgi:hypothetical protein
MAHDPDNPSGVVPPGYSTGLIPRDYRQRPSGYFAAAPTFPSSLMIDEAEWPERLKEQQANFASLWDLREKYYDLLKSYNQNGYGLCWAFSSTKAVAYSQIVMNPGSGVRLSAWWVAGKVKGWRDQGGWGLESTEYIAQHGVPTESTCPAYSSKYDTPTVANEAMLRRVTEWYDGTDSRDQNRHIMVSMFLMGWTGALDYNHLGHSMCGCRLVSIDPLVIDCDNSWGSIDQYGEKGCYRLSGSKAIPDGIVVPVISMPAAA